MLCTVHGALRRALRCALRSHSRHLAQVMGGSSDHKGKRSQGGKGCTGSMSGKSSKGNQGSSQGSKGGKGSPDGGPGGAVAAPTAVAVAGAARRRPSRSRSPNARRPPPGQPGHLWPVISELRRQAASPQGLVLTVETANPGSPRPRGTVAVQLFAESLLRGKKESSR